MEPKIIRVKVSKDK